MPFLWGMVALRAFTPNRLLILTGCPPKVTIHVRYYADAVCTQRRVRPQRIVVVCKMRLGSKTVIVHLH